VETGKSPASRAALILILRLGSLTMIRQEIPRAVTTAHVHPLVIPGRHEVRLA
jgi:hypothetical protein